VIDQIRSVINSGTNYLTEQWENIKQFGSSCFDTIKTGFGNLVHFVTNPLSSLMSALSAMNADLLGSVWSSLKTGANALWEGINSVINGVLQSGEGIWSTVSGFVNGIFTTIAGLFDNSAFDRYRIYKTGSPFYP
jgi:phage-related protein